MIKIFVATTTSFTMENSEFEAILGAAGRCRNLDRIADAKKANDSASRVISGVMLLRADNGKTEGTRKKHRIEG